MPVSLAEMPAMDDHRIGPGGQTFGQLKAGVRDARAAFLASLVGTSTAREGGELLMAYEAAVDLLRAAYTRVGLPYQTP